MLWYLASPYSHADPLVRAARYRAACQATAALLRAGVVVFSPIAHSHALVEYGLPSDWSFWERLDRAYLERCDQLVVLMLAGWQTSVGVQAEIRIADELGMPVSFLDAASWDGHGLPTLAHNASEGGK